MCARRGGERRKPTGMRLEATPLKAAGQLRALNPSDHPMACGAGDEVSCETREPRLACTLERPACNGLRQGVPSLILDCSITPGVQACAGDREEVLKRFPSSIAILSQVVEGEDV